MPHLMPIRIGVVEVVPLCEGVAPIALAAECPGATVDWEAERALHPWAFTPGEPTWPWHVHPIALRTPSGLVMVDAGIGPYPPPTPWSERRDADAELAAAGVDVAEVRHVVHTHLHGDHSGGSIRADGSPRFPNAIHHVHPFDWEDFAGVDDPDDLAARQAMEILVELGMIDLSAQDRTVAPGLRVVHTPGHTRGHRSVILEDGDHMMLLTGDLLHLPVQVAHPDWPSSHDRDPATASRSRAALLAEASTKGWRVAVPHFARLTGHVERDAAGQRWLAD